MKKQVNVDLGSMWERIQGRLREKGIDFELPEGFDISCVGEDGAQVKVVCVAPGLKQSMDEMGQTAREHVVMVRVDSATLEQLDAWVATGAVKSRSEAAALFIREGLKVRGDELERLRDALREVEQAKERLRDRAKEVFGEKP
jgi:Arc/MetJ-type ribon-helix-helix transcriptional regulator